MGVKVDWRRQCGMCRAVYDDDAWRALDLCGSLTSDEVSVFLTAWPAGVFIDLRRCRSCASILARTRPTAAVESATGT